MQIKIVPSCKYNPQIGIGFINYAGLEYQHALTLAMIINTCFDTIADPYFASIKKENPEFADCMLPSVCDFGSLLAASVSRENGIKIYLKLPEFSKLYFESIKFSAALILNQSCWQFVERYNSGQSWIFPIQILSADDLENDFECKIPEFNSDWLTTDALGFLRHFEICNPKVKIGQAYLRDMLDAAQASAKRESVLNIL